MISINSIVDELPSLKEMEMNIKKMKAVGLFMGKKFRNDIKKFETDFEKLIFQIELFNERFSDDGWIVHDKLSFKVIEKVNKIYDENGKNAAEEFLVDYYSSDIDNMIIYLKSNFDEFQMRWNLILKAFDDHKSGRYHASIPLFLMIIDGVVNDYTRSKGFFAEGTDVSAWDCLVGCNSGLIKLKTIYCKGRNKTNMDEIYLPYRNGILHGRDLNYDNVFVSSKCIVLLFATHDWMTNKNSENIRKEKYIDSQKPVNCLELMKRNKKIQEDKKMIALWKPRKIIIGDTIPENGKLDDYKDYAYIQKVLEIFEYWNSKNYGRLSVVLNEVFKHEKIEKLRPKLCRELFQSKKYKTYKLVEVEERGISLSRVLVEVEWESSGKLFTENLEFGVVYRGKNNKTLITEEEGGEWTVIPWNINGLHKG